MLNVDRIEMSEPERGWWLNDPASDRPAFGFVLHLREGVWVVARTLIGSPAEKAGVAEGDRLLSVDDYQVGEGKGDFLELAALMKLDGSSTHQLMFDRQSGRGEKSVEQLPLRQLLELDYDNGGSALRGCVGCRTCRPVTIGATDCSSGCPGNYCTVG